jgi:hypothetical protein
MWKAELTTMMKLKGSHFILQMQTGNSIGTILDRKS